MSRPVRALASAVLVPGVLALFACGPRALSGDESPAPAARLPIEAKTLRFGVSSYTGGSVQDAADPLARYLTATLGIPVELEVDEPYEALPAALRAGRVDIAQLPPIGYVRAKAADPGVEALATPIIGGSPTYVGHLYVRESSSFRTLADLAGRRVGYVSPESSSGYLFPRALLDARGFDPDGFFKEARFYRSHPAVLAAVLRGEVDAGASFDATSDWAGLQDAADRPAGLRVVAKTGRAPNDCVVARAGLDRGTLEAVTRALLDLRPGHPRAVQVLSGLRVNGWVRADERRYDRVREVLAREAARTRAHANGTAPDGSSDVAAGVGP